MRYALAVSPVNYLLFGCHLVNEGAQLTQGYRWLQYNKMGGREAELQKAANEGTDKAAAVLGAVEEKAKNVLETAKTAVGK